MIFCDRCDVRTQFLSCNIVTAYKMCLTVCFLVRSSTSLVLGKYTKGSFNLWVFQARGSLWSNQSSMNEWQLLFFTHQHISMHVPHWPLFFLNVLALVNHEHPMTFLQLLFQIVVVEFVLCLHCLVS